MRYSQKLLRSVLTFGVALTLAAGVTSSAVAQTHYDFRQILASLKPGAPHNLKDVASLSVRNRLNEWRVSPEVLQMDTEIAKETIAVNEPSTAGGGSASGGTEVADAQNYAARMKASAGGITKEEIRNMTMEQKLALARKYQAAAAERAPQAPTQDVLVYKLMPQMQDISGRIGKLMGSFIKSYDSLRVIVSRQHDAIYKKLQKDLAACPPVAANGKNGESSTVSPCEERAQAEAKAANEKAEDASLEACASLVARYRKALEPELASAEKMESDLRNGAAMQGEGMSASYRSFLLNAMQAIAIITHKTVATLSESERWLS